MQLYKKRDFSQYFSDTIHFLKINGKHFLGNYLKIMIIPLLVLGVVAYFFFRYYNLIIQGAFDPLNTVQFISGADSMAFAGVAVLFFIILFFYSAFSYAYTPVYLMLYHEYKTEFTSRDIIATIKSRGRKIIIFSLALIPFFIVISIPLVIVCGVLVITIIGILALPLVFGFMALSVNTALMEYLSTDAKLMESYTFGFNLSFRNFWKAVGCVTLVYIILYLVSSLITGVPTFILAMSKLATNVEAESLNEFFSFSVILNIISMILGIFVYLILQVNEGIIYYSLVEENNNIATYDELDEIGKDN